MQSLPDDGEMATVFADEERVRAVLNPYRGDASIAAVNGPGAIVISGRRLAIRSISDALERDGVSIKPMSAARAFHSPLMDPILDEFERVAAEVQFSAPRIPLVRNVDGRLSDAGDVLDAGYWRRHIREPVRFKEGMDALHR